MMRVTKKLYALLIAGMMAVSLAGCRVQTIAVMETMHRVNKAAKEVQILPPNLYHLTIFRIFQGI